MNRRTVLLALATTVAGTLALAPLTPAQATLDRPVKVVDAFDDTPCGVPVHVEIRGANPVVLTGKNVGDLYDPRIVNTGHVVVRFTTDDGRWMEDDFAGPVAARRVWYEQDGTKHMVIVTDGIREEYLAWDGASARDIGRITLEYVFSPDGAFISRTVLDATGDFPITEGRVDFCDFLQAALD